MSLALRQDLWKRLRLKWELFLDKIEERPILPRTYRAALDFGGMIREGGPCMENNGILLNLSKDLKNAWIELTDSAGGALEPLFEEYNEIFALIHRFELADLLYRSYRWTN
jgi:hypothetical protein